MLKVVALAALLAGPMQADPVGLGQKVEADLDGDTLLDRAYLRRDVSTNAQILMVVFGSGKETRLLSDADPSGSLRLEVRGSGDPRCPDWRANRTCGRNFEIHKGPALAAVQPGERDLIFYWVDGVKFLVERGYSEERTKER